MTTDGPLAAGRSLPRRLGKYAISAVLGEGAMGTVYLGTDSVIERSVAIKTIRKELLHDDSGIDDAALRFRNEARAVGRLSHPGIVAIYEYGETDETAFIAMEFVQGRNLSQVLADPGMPLRDEALVIRLLDQLLDALACAHAEGVWHRDVKPANLILTRGGQLKLTDFGIARIASAALTQVGSAIGTPGFMAPEQYIGEAIDAQVDLYAAGVLLYRLLTGRMPFSGSPENIMHKTLHELPAPPSSIAGALGGGRYDALIARVLQKDPAQRFEDAAAMRRAIRDAGAAAPPADPSDETVIVPPGRLTARLAALASAGQAAGAAAGQPAGSGAAGATGGAGPVGSSGRYVSMGSMGSMGSSGASGASGPSGSFGLSGPSGSFGSSGPTGTSGASGTSGTSGVSAASGAPTSLASGTTYAVPGWDPTVLRTVEQALTRHVGPIARVLVRQAAGRWRDLPSLLAALASHLPADEAEQRRFLAIGGESRPTGLHAATGSATPAGFGTSPSAGARGTGAATGGAAATDWGAAPATEQMAETARLLLTRHIGPIAKVIVRKVMATGPTRADFADRLAAQASDGSNREQLLAELRQALG